MLKIRSTQSYLHICFLIPLVIVVAVGFIPVVIVAEKSQVEGYDSYYYNTTVSIVGENNDHTNGTSLTVNRKLQLGTSTRSLVVSDTVVKFTCNATLDELKALKAPSIKLLRTSLVFFGTNQVTSINQNPIIAAYSTRGRKLWCRDDYETTGTDGRAIGLMVWPSRRSLYAVFTADGTQGTPDQDFRRFTADGWQTSYGNGGGPKVSIIVKLNRTTGEGISGTFLRAQLSDGKTNSLVVKNLQADCNSNVLVQSDSYFLPLKVDGKTPFAVSDCAPDTSSPFDYTVILSRDLKKATSAECRKVDSC